MDIFNKKITRREFLWSVLAGLGLLLVGNTGRLAKDLIVKSESQNHRLKSIYSNDVYGGVKKT